jgi:hypothetical protein
MCGSWTHIVNLSQQFFKTISDSFNKEYISGNGSYSVSPMLRTMVTNTETHDIHVH